MLVAATGGRLIDGAGDRRGLRGWLPGYDLSSVAGSASGVTDAMEAVRQNVEQEAADELVGAKGHHLLLVVVAIILPAEADPALGKTDKAAVGDGNAMGIAGEINRAPAQVRRTGAWRRRP